MEFDQVPKHDEVLSRFIFSSSHFTRSRVKPDAPDNVPERHAAIIGWPDQKDEQLSLAQCLAEVATLFVPS
jgi:hypothetical protein